jgi:Sec-independent protein translocase protein TatA
MDFNILGIGPAELVLIILIMLIFLGPKRMLSWTYLAGRYMARMRAMFEETMSAVRKEFEQAQIDLPKDLPRIPNRRFDIVKEANKLVSSELNRPSEGTTPAPEARPAPEAEPSPAQPDTPEDETQRYDAWLPK